MSEKVSKTKYNKFYYKPLPTFLTIKPSAIEGLGLYATDTIKENTDLGMSHIKVPLVFGYIRTPLGGFFNHDDDANCYIQEDLDWDDYRVFHVYTLRDIDIGEELTLNYYIDQE
jgi:SET domain-containing protein